MFLAELIFAILIAMLLSLVFSIGLRRPGPWGNILIFFMIVFLATWAASMWIAPVGPVLLGINWIPLVLIGLIVAMILAAVVPPGRPDAAPASDPDAIAETRDDVEQREVVGHTLDVFFWILSAVLVILIAAGYIMAS